VSGLELGPDGVGGGSELELDGVGGGGGLELELDGVGGGGASELELDGAGGLELELDGAGGGGGSELDGGGEGGLDFDGLGFPSLGSLGCGSRVSSSTGFYQGRIFEYVSKAFENREKTNSPQREEMLPAPEQRPRKQQERVIIFC